MIHPSYKEMIEKINETSHPGDMDISNRYSLVLATAKRARQINAGSEPLVPAKSKEKNLSVAVEEFYAGKVHVLDDEYEDEVYYEDENGYDYSVEDEYGPDSEDGEDSDSYEEEDADEENPEEEDYAETEDDAEEDE